MAHPRSDFGVGASPILAAGRLIVPRDGAEEAAVLALDPATGEEVYRIERFGFYNSHATPFLWRNALREELVLTGTRQLHAHDPATGEALWNVQDVTIFTCTTPTGDAERLYYAGWSTPNADGRSLLDSAFDASFELSEQDYEDLGPLFERLDANDSESLTPDEIPPGRARDAFGSLDENGNGVWERGEFIILNGAIGAPGQNVALAVRAGGSGDVTDTHVAWRWSRGVPYVSSPLVHEGRVWLIKRGGIVTTLDAVSGQRRIDRERLPTDGEYYASPVGVGGCVLVGAVSGELFVLEAADELRVVNTLDFDDPVFATPAAIDGRLFVRTNGAVWAF